MRMQDVQLAKIAKVVKIAKPDGTTNPGPGR